jgi:transcriptional regulator NrdR family protein
MKTGTAKLPCHCGGQVLVINTRVYGDGLVHRRHRCAECHTAYSTVEVRIDKYRKMLAELDDFKKLKEVLSR